jgi:hypothetical protein
MTRYYKVRDREGLVRDMQSGAIVNVDESSWQAHQNAKKIRDKQNLEKQIQKDKINNLQQDVENIKSELFGMKDLLLQVLEKLNGRN